MSKRPMVPSFLQKIDDKLLRDKPGVWAARTHLVVFFAAVFAVLLFAFCYFIFFDAKQFSRLSGWNIFLGMIAFIGFIFWLIFLLRFNVFKRFGNSTPLDGLRDFLLYFVAIGSMVAVCFIPSIVETIRANQQFGNEEVISDVNELNLTAAKLEYNILPLRWKTDTCRVVNEKYNVSVPSDEVIAEPTVDSVSIQEVTNYIRSYHQIDTAELRSKLQYADSLLKLNDSTYVFYEPPVYKLISSYTGDDHSKVKQLNSAEIYNTVIKKYVPPADRQVLLKRMQELKIKYAVNSPYYYGDYYDGNNADYISKINKKYDFTRINNGIENVVRKKYAWTDDWPVYLRIFYYLTLVFTMLVFIFKQSTAKTFFLSVLTAVLLVIITALCMLFTQGSEDTAILSFIIVYYVVFAVLGLSVLRGGLRTAVQGIGINLFLFMTPFIPLIFVTLYQSMKSRYDYEVNAIYTEDTHSSALYYLIAEIAGAIILLILIQPLFKKLYRKWFAAPEE